MLKPSPDSAGSWAITEENGVFRIVDAAGLVLAEIAFGYRSASNLSRSDARKIAEDMVVAGDVLAKAGKKPTKPQGS